MRRFFFWSVLSALMGVVLAGVGFGAFWMLHARFEPVVLPTANAEGVQRLLDEASWVSDGAGGPPVYVVGWRDSEAVERFMRDEAPRLRALGVETRLILFARPDQDGTPRSTATERATVAELWLSRDWSLYRRWAETPARSWTAAGLPSADQDLSRAAMVEAGRRFDADLTAKLRPAGVVIRYPLILWRDRNGTLTACGCSDSRTWARIENDLETAATPRPEARSAPGRQERDVAAPVRPSLAYPELPPPAARPIPTPGAAAPASPTAQPQAPAAERPRNPPTGARPPAAKTPRPAPLPRREEDTTFF
ncbi:hypothetical protein [Brevundimonas sp. SORGH_AS_0993]|uniref:hypothetical protein n=1 Tax=Brevundimonas sp. SORGH_AS_0993 TaxID=3041794 RepID=UPI00278640ED|nr:hypothetical protein [Brevundimonas sp. SORGH_AS_0993]MDQ1154896.1 hypothetical protein [Brevundimonas sp. SORGH_AS_0993]